MVIVVIIVSCGGAARRITIVNRTEQKVDFFVDTLYLMTLKPDSLDHLIVEEHLPTTLYLDSRYIDNVRLSRHIDSVRDTIIYQHHYKFEGKVNDSIIFNYTFKYYDLMRDDTVIIIKEKNN